MPAGLRQAFLQATAQDTAVFHPEEGGYRLAAHGVSARVDRAGLSLSLPREAGASWRMRLSGIGRGKNRGTARSAELREVFGGVALQRRGVSEWYRNTAHGIEQGFTLEQRPPGDGQLLLRLAIDTALPASVSKDRRNLRFALGDGSSLHYDGLVAFDAGGASLEARLIQEAGAIVIEVDDRHAAYPITIDPLIFLETKVTAFDGQAGDFFGRAVAISGDTAIVGAFRGDVNANANQGSAYVFTRSGGIWSLQAKLTASDGGANDWFGISVALYGDTALVGAPSDDGGALFDQGSAYVFVRSGGTWSQQTKLTASDGAANDQFGYSVALSGDTAVVGAIGDVVGANVAQGSAYVFVRTGAAWSEQAHLTAPDGGASDFFGYSVALSGDTALISAHLDDVNANQDQGSAHVFVRSGTLWSHQGQLTALDGAGGDFFGVSVALSGDTALVGASQDDVVFNAQGSAYVFTRTSSLWSQQARLTASGGAADDNFGQSVALFGDFALVGAYNDDVGANVNQGSAYLFLRLGTTWSQMAQLLASDGAAIDGFGYVALSGDTALVGACNDDNGAIADQGSAYFFGIYPSRSDHDLSVAASSAASGVLPGDSIALTAAITNYGPATADFLLVESLLPAGLTYVSHAAATGFYDPAGGTWNVGGLSLGMNATLTIQATVDPGAAGTQPVFTAALLGSDTNTANNSASVALNVAYVGASQAAYDGWVLESGEASSKGGKVNAGATTLFVGDDKANRQYRAVLCFDTSALPDNAVITSARLMLKSAGIKGTDPFRTHRGLLMDIRTGTFANRDTLQTLDFQAAASRMAAGTVGKTLAGGWYSGALSAGALPLVNKAGLTQLRLRFKRDDNNDRGADYLKLFSGNAAPADAPVLVVEYAVP